MSEEEFTFGWSELWHWAMLALTKMQFAGDLIQDQVKAEMLTRDQWQLLEMVARAARRARDNWTWTTQYYLRHLSREELVQFACTWWCYEADLLRGVSEAIDNWMAGALGGTAMADEDHRALQIVQRGCHLVADDWQHGKDWLQIWCGLQDEWEWISLPNVVDRASEYLKATYEIRDLDVTIPQHLPLVKGNSWLPRAVINMVSCVDLHSYHGGLFRDRHVSHTVKSDYRPSITVEYGNDKVTVEIAVGLTADTNGNQYALSSELFVPGTRLSVASFVIAQYDRQATFHISDQCSRFRFTLTARGRDRN